MSDYDHVPPSDDEVIVALKTIRRILNIEYEMKRRHDAEFGDALKSAYDVLCRIPPKRTPVSKMYRMIRERCAGLSS